jgi:hypothetical protein
MGWVRIAEQPAFTNLPKLKCAAQVPAPAGGTVASSGSADTTTGPTVAGVVVGVFVLGAIGAALYYNVFSATAGSAGGPGKLVKNPVGSSV